MDAQSIGLAALAAAFGEFDYSVTEDGAICLYGTYDVAEIAKVLSKNGVLVTQLSCQAQSIEEFYFSMIESTSI